MANLFAQIARRKMLKAMGLGPKPRGKQYGPIHAPKAAAAERKRLEKLGLSTKHLDPISLKQRAKDVRDKAALFRKLGIELPPHDKKEAAEVAALLKKQKPARSTKAVKPPPNDITLRVPKGRATSVYKTLEQVGFQMLGEAQTGDPSGAKQRRREAADLELLRDQLAEQLP